MCRDGWALATYFFQSVAREIEVRSPNLRTATESCGLQRPGNLSKSEQAKAGRQQQNVPAKCLPQLEHPGPHRAHLLRRTAAAAYSVRLMNVPFGGRSPH